MISFDLECSRNHRFEGVFKDYESFNSQLADGMVRCPVCDDTEIRRLFTGCSIQAKSALQSGRGETPTMFQMMKMVRQYVLENFEHVGRDFPEIARAIHYGDQEEKNIYGETNPNEIKELLEEGIGVMPLPDVEKLEN
ncbi:MAG TPA: DUF1178 family protein, partial [Spirochaetes bacterium]|nr:DUF1178 family protein [Spirochaetota bacterium]